MRRFLRIIVKAAAVFSSLLAIATIALWFRSYHTADGLLAGRWSAASRDQPNYLWLLSSRGQIRINTSSEGRPGKTTSHDVYDPVDWNNYDWKYHALGFAGGETGLLIPLWAITALLVLFPVIASWPHKKRNDSQSAKCPNCGYDLRATPDRCPECGKPAVDLNQA
jgi:hypothetical protein